MRPHAFWRLVAQAWGTPFAGVGAATAFAVLAVPLVLLAQTQSRFDAAAGHVYLLTPLLLLPAATAVFAWDHHSGLHRVLGSTPVAPGTLAASRACAVLLWSALLLAATLPAMALLGATFGPMAWAQLPGLARDHLLVALPALTLGTLLGLAIRAHPLAAMSLASGWACAALLLHSLGAEEGLIRALLRATPLHPGLARAGILQAAALATPILLVALLALLAGRRSDVAGWTGRSSRALAMALALLAVAAIALVPLPAGAEEGRPGRAAMAMAVDPPPFLQKGSAYVLRIEGLHTGDVRVVDEGGRVLGEGSVAPAGEGSEARFHLHSAPATTPTRVRVTLIENGGAIQVEPALVASTRPPEAGLAALLCVAAALPAGLILAVRRIPNARQPRI